MTNTTMLFSFSSLSCISLFFFCWRLEPSATWNALPWLRKVSKQYLMKQSSPFFIPRRKRNAALIVTAPVQLSEVACNLSSPYLRVPLASNLSHHAQGGHSQRGDPFVYRLAPLLSEPAKHSTLASQLPPPSYPPEASTVPTLQECWPSAQPVSLLWALAIVKGQLAFFYLFLPRISNHHWRIRRGTWFLNWWPSLIFFY